MSIRRIAQRAMDRLLRRSRLPSAADANRAFARVVRRCPVCGGDVRGTHDYWVLASAISASPAAREVARRVESRRWREASVYEWDPRQDAVQYTVIRCPAEARLGLVRTLHTAELLAGSGVESAAVVDDTAALLELAASRWEHFLPANPRKDQ